MSDTSPPWWLISALFICAAVFLHYHNQGNVESDNVARVETDCGPVVGEKDDTHEVFVFKGVPFAVPPTGERRWEPPGRMSKRDGTCWKGIYQANQYPNQCAQLAPDTKQFTGDEDCLYLNIHTPLLSNTARKPVMVYIHGGYIHFCNASMKGYTPNPWVTEHLDVVFVSIQYRMNSLGFLVLDELGKGSNYGILDLVEALQWVQRNVQNFGGDPNHVTVLGQSAGGTLIYSLLASPLTRGLFHRAWIISGSSKMQTTWEEANTQNRFLIQKTGCKTKQCFKDLSTQEVVESVYPEWDYDIEMSLPEKGVHTAALIVVDGYILPNSPQETWQKGDPNLLDVSILIGTTAEETDMDWWSPVGHDLESWSQKQLSGYVASRLDQFGTNITNKCLNLYPVEENARVTLMQIITDVRCTCGNDYLTEKVSGALKSGVFRYLVTSRPSTPIHAFHLPFASKYAFHGWDMFAFFDEIMFWTGGVPASASDEDFKRLIQENVMHFVHHGTPKHQGWKQYPTTAVISDTITPVDHLNKDKCNFWMSNNFFNYTWLT